MITGIEQYHLERAGYFIRRGAIEPTMIADGLAAMDRIADKARGGQHEFLRFVVPTRDDIWAVNYVFHPGVREDALLRLLGSPAVLDPLEGALGSKLRYHLATLLLNPELLAYRIRWHRDCGPDVDEPEYEQRAHLARWHEHLQLNAAMLCDECLLVLPGTHAEPLAAEQLAAVRSDALGDVPGAVRVRLAPGDVVFYNANLLHRADCSPETPRRTFHAAVFSMTQPEQPIVQQPWLADAAFLARLPARLRPLFDRFNDLARLAPKERVA